MKKIILAILLSVFLCRLIFTEESANNTAKIFNITEQNFRVTGEGLAFSEGYIDCTENDLNGSVDNSREG
ncbi:MAG: hypothetical protein ACI9LM_004855 [Alteromonadaceae bacterium]|jgi:hypothetical protein